MRRGLRGCWSDKPWTASAGIIAATTLVCSVHHRLQTMCRQQRPFPQGRKRCLHPCWLIWHAAMLFMQGIRTSRVLVEKPARPKLRPALA